MKNPKTKLSHVIYALLIVGVLTACTAYSSRVDKDTIETNFGGGIIIMTIDKCEYVWVKRGYGGGLTHKGNCKNPEHINLNNIK